MTRVTKRLKSFMQLGKCFPPCSLNCGSIDAYCGNPKSCVMGDHQSKNDKAATLLPSSRTLTGSTTPSVPGNFLAVIHGAFFPSVTSNLLMMTLKARESQNLVTDKMVAL